VEAHIGGSAAGASKAIGAEAYTTGNHVAFPGQPDLHTAAHEAAHVVQQRSGLTLPNGVGREGDEFEQRADAAADAVARGESAQAILDQDAGTETHERNTVQRKKADPGFTRTDDERLVTLLLRATAAEAKEAASQVEQAQETGSATDTRVAFIGGCMRTNRMLEHAMYSSVFSGADDQADLTKLFAPSDLAFGWIRALLQYGDDLELLDVRGPAELQLAAADWQELLEPYGWKTATTGKAARRRGERRGQRPHLRESERREGVGLTLELARHEVTHQLGQMGNDKSANAALVKDAALGCYKHLLFAESCLRQPSALSPEGTGDPGAEIVPQATKAGRKFKGDIAVTIEVLKSLFAAGRRWGEMTLLEDVYILAIRLGLHCGISPGNHPAYGAGSNEPMEVAFESWNVPDLCDHQLNQVEAALTNLDGALGVWERFLDTPSTDEAKERPLAELAAEAAREQLFDLMLTPLSGVPGGNSAKKQAEERARSKRDKEGIYVRDFVVGLRQGITKQISSLQSQRVPYTKGVQSSYDRLSDEGQKIEFRAGLRATAETMRANLGGPASVSGFFTAITRSWVLGSRDPKSGSLSYLELEIDGNWQVDKASLHAPRGSRIAEALMKQHGGNLNLKELAVPLVVKWFPARNKNVDGISSGDFVRARLAGDGSLVVVFAETVPDRYEEVLRQRLIRDGIPQVTKLDGTQAS
jgi:hypothetical protein